MIRSLHISNYALIDSLEIDFNDGLNIITGETGAGKSIMLDALSVLLGERAEQKVIRDRERKSVIEAVFQCGALAPELRSYCNDNDIEWIEDDTCIVRREISPSGRSRAFVNDSPVTLTQLRGLSMRLVDLHSQHQNLLLASPDYQLQILDSLAGNEDMLAQYKRLYAQYKSSVAKYRRAKRDIAEAAQDGEFASFQLQQIAQLNLTSGEQEQLERERDLLTNIGDVKRSLAMVREYLIDGQQNVLSMLRTATDTASDLTTSMDDVASLIDRLDTAYIEIHDIADTFTDYDERIEADPNRLEYIEERLNEIYALERKHGVDSVDDLLEIAHTLQQRLASIESADETLTNLESAARQAKSEAVALARQISEKRQSQAARFAEELRDKALPLGMRNLAIDIRVTQGELSVSGMDKVEFLFAFNKNQTLMPVGDTASGGEISRLMLVIKAIVATKMMLPTIIFDEIDTGVSGDVALRMGGMMVDIAESGIQVIAITHLPQVASQGKAHYKVYKEDDDTSTMTRIRVLSAEERVGELALMLSGSTSDEAALAAARSLLAEKHERKGSHARK